MSLASRHATVSVPRASGAHHASPSANYSFRAPGRHALGRAGWIQDLTKGVSYDATQAGVPKEGARFDRSHHTPGCEPNGQQSSGEAEPRRQLANGHSRESQGWRKNPKSETGL